jgi:copper homeostasis protein
VASPHRVLLEIAAFDLASALVAAGAGADRLELCRDAAAGGLTPPMDWVEAAVDTGVPVAVMIRAHADGWTFAPDEHAAMRADAIAAVRAGAAAVVWGALRTDATVDAPALRALVEAVAPVPVVVHRAFDAARDLDEALDALVACGAARVLTSGGAATALDGADRLAALAHRAAGALTILPGGGVRAGTVAGIVRRSGAAEVHSGASAPGTGRVDPAEVRRLRAALDALP